jgi:peptidyl-prolyl cis-trans isomerase B (cyclophilin B)
MNKRNTLIIVIIIIIAFYFLIRQNNTETDMTKATIKTNKGDIELELYPDKVPNTVENFVKLANEGFYDGVYFHRVIPDFMIQTGDPQAKGVEGQDFVYEPDSSGLPIAGTGGPDYKFADEFHPELRHDVPGVLSMANSGPDTNGSQFFITHVPTPWLDDVHSIFGKVLVGQDVVNSIARGDKIETIIIK